MRADSLEKTLMLERLKAGGKGDNRGQDNWMASPTQCEFEQAPGDGEARKAWRAAVQGVVKSWTPPSN